MTCFVTADGVCKVTHTRDDGRGGNIRVALWNQPGNDVTGMVARSQKIAGTFEKVTYDVAAVREMFLEIISKHSVFHI